MKKEEISKIIIEYLNKFGKISIKNTLWYLSRHNYIKRIFLDYYYINSIEERELETCKYEEKELLFEVLNKEKVKWYMGLNSAKYYSGKIWQFPVILTIINNRFSGRRVINGMKTRFIKIKKDLIFGLISKKTKNKIKYYYSDRQKTNLDFLYFKQVKKIPIDKKTKKYAEKYPKWLFKK